MSTAKALTTKTRKMGFWDWLDKIAKTAFRSNQPGQIVDMSETYWRPLFRKGLSPSEAIDQYNKDKVTNE